MSGCLYHSGWPEANGKHSPENGPILLNIVICVLHVASREESAGIEYAVSCRRGNTTARLSEAWNIVESPLSCPDGTAKCLCGPQPASQIVQKEVVCDIHARFHELDFIR
jgi:hypothetical protein